MYLNLKPHDSNSPELMCILRLEANQKLHGKGDPQETMNKRQKLLVLHHPSSADPDILHQRFQSARKFEVRCSILTSISSISVSQNQIRYIYAQLSEEAQARLNTKVVIDRLSKTKLPRQNARKRAEYQSTRRFLPLMIS